MHVLTDLFSSRSLGHVQPADEVKLDPVDHLAVEKVFEIFSHLDLGALNYCLRVSKKWRQIADDDSVFKAVIYGAFAFNKEKWAKYHGEVGQELALPTDSRSKLKESHQILKEYHSRIKKIPIEEVRIDPVQRLFKLISLFPTIDGKPFEAEMYGELVKNPKAGHRTSYDYFSPEAMAEHGKKSPNKPYWILITKTVIEGSILKSYEEQKALVATLPGFEIPKLLEAIAANFTEYVETGIRLYSDNPCTFTHCQESTRFGQKDFQLAVGGFGFAPRGLQVPFLGIAHYPNGVAALRKF